VSETTSAIRDRELCYLTAISLPNGQSQAGLPIGVQLVGRHFEEATILRAAAAFETRVNFATPPL
jgi:aspartyl-tRNA(Asn)/glutamyl-tRNA(Gln) amidotransferase subunit A